MNVKIEVFYFIASNRKHLKISIFSAFILSIFNKNKIMTNEEIKKNGQFMEK